YYVEQYDPNAYCTSNPRQLAIVKVKPLAPVVTNTTYCQNNTAAALNATAAIGGTLNWYGTDATGGTASNIATIPSTSNVGATNYYVSQTVNGVESDRAIISVQVNALPASPSSITGNTTVTTTTIEVYSVTNVVGMTYQWTLPSFMSGSSSTNSISTNINTAGSGNLSVVAINANGCKSSPASTLVITSSLFVTPVPAATNAIFVIGDAANPANTNPQITGANGATLSFYTSASGGTSTSAQNLPSTPGVYTYYVSQTINGIESALVAYTVTMKPLVPTIAAISYCQNATAIALTATGTALKWYATSTSTPNLSSAPIPATNTAGSTSYYVSQTVNGVESDRIALVVTINPTPAQPSVISGTAIVLAGSAQTYSVVNDVSVTSYTWTLPNGWTGTSNTNTIIATAGSSGTISVTANNLFGSSAPRTFNVTVITVNANVNQAGTTLTATAAGAGYQWVNCNGYSIISGQVSQSYTATVSGSYAVIVTQNGCSDTSACYSVYIGGPPPKPGDISGNILVCHGSINTYSVAPVNGATSYTWTLPGGWSGSSTTNSIDATVNSSGTISVTANNTYGSSVAQTLYVTVVSVNTNVTQSGSTLTSGATGATYQWVDCNGYTPLAGQTYQSFTATAPGNYAVIITQQGCVDTSSCFSAGSTGCGITITGADLPYDGLNVILAVDTVTNVSLGSAAPGQVWNYASLTMQYPKYASYKATSTTPYAATYPASNISTYGPGDLYGSLYGGAPVGPGNGYCFWKSDNSGFWVMGFRPESGMFAGVDVQNSPPELVIGAPANYGNVFTAYGRWELPMNDNPADVDTFYVRTIKKQIIADACGSITTPYGTYPNVLREHEFISEIDSVYGRFMGFQVYATEYAKDSSNTYSYLANGVGYPVCIVHCDKNNVVQDVEYFAGYYIGVEEKPSNDQTILVYPNPSDGHFTIEMPKGTVKSGDQISIYNAVGSLVWQENATVEIVHIDISALARGVYTVRIKNADKVLIQKVVIE
ncbi:MAG: T9SS type A sorting domain-containing protein, partial [Bacteroidota bacterium]